MLGSPTKPMGSMVEVVTVTPFMGCKPGTKGLLTSWDILVKYVHVTIYTTASTFSITIAWKCLSFDSLQEEI